jgi:hypothetical protein
MVEFYDRAQRVVPVLFLPAANRQHMVEAKAGILLPEPQNRLQIVRRKSEVDGVFCEQLTSLKYPEQHEVHKPENFRTGSVRQSARRQLSAEGGDKQRQRSEKLQFEKPVAKDVWLSWLQPAEKIKEFESDPKRA